MMCLEKGIMRILILIIITFNLTFSQNITIKGKVTDAVNNVPIQGAIIFIPANNIAYTNSAGEFEIKNQIPGKVTVRVSHIGFKSLAKEILIQAEGYIYNFALTPSPIKLDEVLVSVDRRDRFLKDSPFSIVLTDREQIGSKNFNSLSDVLSEEAGISIVKDGVWGTDLNIRGLSRNNVVAIIDGTRIETANDLSARLSMINLHDIERIEVIKGAASSVYGSGATGGIVNIVSSLPSFSKTYSFSGNISSGYSSVNNLKSIAGTIYNSGYFWSSKLSGSYIKADDIETPAGKLRNSRFSDYSFSGSVNIQPISNHLIKLNYQHFKAEDVGLPGGAPLFPEQADVRYPVQKRELISAGYEIQNLSSVFSKVLLRYSHQYILRDVENIPNIIQNVPPRRISVLKIAPRADHNSHNFLAQTNLVLSQSNLLTVGIDFWSRSYNGERLRYQKIEMLDSTGNTVVNTINRVIAEKPLPDSRMQSIGLFAQDDLKLIKDKLKLSIGARIDKIDISGEETLNPLYEINNGIINNSPANQTVIWKKTNSDDVSYSSNIGANYSITTNLDFTLSLGYSFRSPSLEERFQFIDLGNLKRVGNPELNPEKGYSTDIGFRYYQSDLKIISSFFYNYITDIVVEKPGVFNGESAQIKTNIGKARLYGFDFLLNYNLYNDWMAFFTISYVKGDDLSEDINLPQIPPLNGTAGMKMSLLNNFNIELSSSLFAAQNEISTGEIKTPGYATFNLALQVKNISLASIVMNINAGVENIFDKSYRNHLSTTRGGITAEPGRNFYIRLVTGW